MKRVFVSAVLVALCASACGGGSSKASVSSASTPSSTPSATDTASPAASIDVQATADASLPDINALKGNCKAIAEQFSTSAGSLQTDSAAEISKTFIKLGGLLHDYAGAVSDAQVKAALDDFATLYVKAGTSLKGVTYTPGQGAPPPQFAAFANSFDTSKTQAEGKVLEAYFTSGNCS